MVVAVVSEGGRSPSTLSPGHGCVGQRGLAPGQRWSVGRKREVVLRLLRGESVELLSRELGAVVAESWPAIPYEKYLPIIDAAEKVT